jgi:hypothetical protein
MSMLASLLGLDGSLAWKPRRDVSIIQSPKRSDRNDEEFGTMGKFPLSRTAAAIASDSFRRSTSCGGNGQVLRDVYPSRIKF